MIHDMFSRFFFKRCLSCCSLDNYLRVKKLPFFIPPKELAQQTNSTKGRLVQGLYKPIHGTCAMYFYVGVIWCTSLETKTVGFQDDCSCP